ncbi:MAG: beta-ketoacyl synthase chain length factor [Methylococcales bacterium]|nr:beta-ketoacyl synthase chain length factor [Methylococcales bacterium]
MNQNFILKKWSVWPPLEGHEKSEESNKAKQLELLSVVPKMLKRRLSPLARIVFCAASQCIADNKNIPTVFSSTHGELAKSFAMMEMIEMGEEISPTAFSLSVHNAIAGLFSMAYKNKVQSTVVAPGEEGIAAAFIEAVGLLQEGESEVLVVLYDEPLVSFYPSAPYQLSTDNSQAVALHITKQGAGLPLSFNSLPDCGDMGEQPLQVLQLISFLSGTEKKLMINTARHSWCWNKQ